MRTAFATSLLAAVSMAEPLLGDEFKFMNFIAKWGKAYNTMEEYNSRFANWKRIDDFINENNHPDSGETHTAGHNKFSDWTKEEYRGMLGYKKDRIRDPNAPVHEVIPSNAD
jgi:hypothetical protein